MDKLKKELEVLKSWGFETVPIDKVLEMIERTEDTESESAEKSVINIYYPPVSTIQWLPGLGVPLTCSGRTFNRGDLIPFGREIWYT